MSRSQRSAALMAAIIGLSSGVGGRFDQTPIDNRKKIDDPPLVFKPDNGRFKPSKQKFVRRKSETRKTQHRSSRK